MLVKPPYPRLQRAKFVSDGLVGAWGFYEGSGLTLHDLSGKDNHGTLVAGPTWEPGRAGYAMDFDGTSRVQMGNISEYNFGTNDFSIAVFVLWRTTTGTHSDGVISKGEVSPGDYLLYLVGTTAGSSSIRFYADGGTINLSPSIQPVGTGWRHVVVTRNESEAIMYLDGVRIISRDPEDANLSNSTGFAMGGADHGSSRRMDGQIDDVRLYNRALSAEEIKLIYTGHG